MEKKSNLLFVRMDNNNNNNNVNTNIVNSLYLDLTDEEIINIASNMNLPDFIRQLPYLIERLQQINNKFE